MTPAFSYGEFARQFTGTVVDDLMGPDKFRLWLLLAVLPPEARTSDVATLFAHGLTHETVRRATVRCSSSGIV